MMTGKHSFGLKEEDYSFDPHVCFFLVEGWSRVWGEDDLNAAGNILNGFWRLFAEGQRPRKCRMAAVGGKRGGCSTSSRSRFPTY